MSDPGKIDPISLNFLDVAKPNGYLAVITGVMQYIQGKMSLSLQPRPSPAGSAGKDDFASSMSAMMSKQFLYFFPALAVFIGFQLPAGLSVYWLVSTIFAIAQQYFVTRDKNSASPGHAKI